MGFPMGYSVGVIGLLPSLFLNSLSIFDSIGNLLLLLLRPLGLSGLIGPVTLRPESTRPGSIPAWLVRGMLPVAKFSEVAGAGGLETPEECAVCLYDFEEEAEIRRLRNCRHIFHKGCLDRWMEHDRMTCPLCRTPLVSLEIQEVFTERPLAEISSTGFVV